MDAYIQRRRRALPPKQRDYAANNALWWPLFEEEWRATLVEFDGPYHNRFNASGHRSWWCGRSIEAVLREYGYMLEYHHSPCLMHRSSLH
jgi:hypothetical protein